MQDVCIVYSKREGFMKSKKKNSESPDLRLFGAF